MRVLITGAAGMLGRKLTSRLLQQGTLAGRVIDTLDLLDVVPAPTPGPSPTIRLLVADLAQAGAAADAVAERPDVVFHLAGVVSGEAEADMAKGYRVNLDGTRALFDALAALPRAPRVVFTSSIAVYGAPFPPVIDDEFHLTPLTSYGTQKAIGEALLADYSRRGLIDGVGVRLPTITVRPGRPNAAASGFFSGIIREPLNGEPARLPVSRSVRHAHASPRSAVGFLVHAAELDTGRLGERRNLMMPSLSVTVAEQIEALSRVAGPEVTSLIHDEPDPAVAGIVAGWPQALDARRARSLGFTSESTYDEIIRVYLTDDRDPHGASGDGAAGDGAPGDGTSGGPQ